MTNLHLVLKKKWFDLILSGIKKEEYREIKPYWVNRLYRITPANVYQFEDLEELSIELKKDYGYEVDAKFRPFTHITFQHGYSKSARRMTVECQGIAIAEGNPDWGAEPGKKYFIIKLGNILTTENL